MNTHQKYRTVAHHHFASTIGRNGPHDIPDSALMLVGCEDGRWFLQQEYGDEYGRFPGIVKSGDDLETEPTFYADVDAVATAAYHLIKQFYPITEDYLADFIQS